MDILVILSKYTTNKYASDDVFSVFTTKSRKPSKINTQGIIFFLNTKTHCFVWPPFVMLKVWVKCEISLQHPPGSFFLFPSQRSLSCHRCKGHLSCSAAIYSIQIKLRSHVALAPSHLSPQCSCKGLIYKPNNKLPFSIPYKAHKGLDKMAHHR